MKWIIDSWYNNTIIKSDVIVKSFLVTGISNNLDGSEDEEFNGFILESNSDFNLVKSSSEGKSLFKKFCWYGWGEKFGVDDGVNCEFGLDWDCSFVFGCLCDT